MNTVFLHGKSVRKDGTTHSHWTRQVEAKDVPMYHHLHGLSYTASGYGKAIPTSVMVKFNNRWRRVYCCIFGNVGTCYIKTGTSEMITVESYNQ